MRTEVRTGGPVHGNYKAVLAVIMMIAFALTVITADRCFAASGQTGDLTKPTVSLHNTRICIEDIDDPVYVTGTASHAVGQQMSIRKASDLMPIAVGQLSSRGTSEWFSIKIPRYYLKKGVNSFYVRTEPLRNIAQQSSYEAVTVVVADRPLQSISLNCTQMTMNIATDRYLSISYNPSNTTDSKNVTWRSSDNGIATVDCNGRVIARNKGTATLTACVGSKRATCRVTVVVPSSKPATTTKPTTTTTTKTTTTKPTTKATTKTTTKTTATTTKKSSVGKYKNVSQAYTLFNKFRTTKSNQWYWKKGDKAKARTYGLKKVKRSTALEKTAKVRAKEAWIMLYERNRMTHDRLDNSKPFTAYPKSIKPTAENLAWRVPTAKLAIEAWAEKNEKNAGQGHRRAMLDKRVKKVGIACYEKDGLTCWAMCLGY